MSKLVPILMALAFSQVLGQGSHHNDSSDVLVRVHAPVLIPAGDSVGTAVVVDDTITVDGIVQRKLVVVRGTAIISGTVLEDVVVIRGHLVLNEGARVGGDVMLFRSTIDQAPGATVSGQVQTRQRFFPGAAVPWFFWLATLIASIIFGVLLVTFASRQITDAADIVVQQTGKSALWGLAIWVGLPALAVISFFSLIGIPLGIVIFLMILPLLWIAGHTIVALTTGVMILKKRNNASSAPHPYLTLIIGILALHLVWAIPFVGGVVIFILVWLGSGALAYRMWQQRWRQKG